MTHIQVSQLTRDMTETVVIGQYELVDRWERLERIFAVEVKNPPSEHPLQVWIEEKNEDGDLTDRCIAVAPYHGIWFLRDFLNQPDWELLETAVEEAS